MSISDNRCLDTLTHCYLLQMVNVSAWIWYWVPGYIETLLHSTCVMVPRSDAGCLDLWTYWYMLHWVKVSAWIWHWMTGYIETLLHYTLGQRQYTLGQGHYKLYQGHYTLGQGHYRLGQCTCLDLVPGYVGTLLMFCIQKLIIMAKPSCKDERKSM